MKNNISPQDLKNISAYLDGELNASSSRKMKDRLERDPNLRTALDAMRVTKNILQRTPKRPAPRNFTLSSQMVAKSPPLPRMVPALNYATAFAMILFFFSVLPPFSLGSESMAPANKEMLMESADMAMEEFAPAEEPAEEAPAEEEAMPMAEAPAMEEEVFEEAEAAPVAEGESAGLSATEETSSRAEAETEKVAETDQVAESTPFASLQSTAIPNSEEVPEPIPAPSFTRWQEILLVLILLFALGGFFFRRRAMLKWESQE